VSSPVILSPQADEDLAEAVRWYERRQPGLGAILVMRVDEQLERIGDNPDLYPEVRLGMRRSPVRRFPYGIFYRRRPNYVQVVAIVHERRHPAVWEGRV
jgi:plasmid stabilization system protein ParE